MNSLPGNPYFPPGCNPADADLPDPICEKCEAKLTDKEIEFCETTPDFDDTWICECCLDRATVLAELADEDVD